MENKIYDAMDWPRIEAILYGEEASPRDVMAPRLVGSEILVQGFFPDAAQVFVKIEKTGKRYPMEMEEEEGYFAGILPCTKVPVYSYQVEKKDGTAQVYYDPYAFPCQLTEEDERAFLAGVHYDVYKKLGAHPMTLNGVSGTCFALWAPNAMRVSVVGDFNGWDGRKYPMHRMPMSGIFELFVPNVKAGDNYKYEIKRKDGEVHLKADPYAQATEPDGGTASLVADTAYSWKDEKWICQRGKQNTQALPMCIYETDLGDWSGEGQELKNYREMAADILQYVKEMGYTHVELHPVMEYLDEASGGYDTTNYFAPTSRYGSPEDFMAFIDLLHQGGIGVILDWVPSHFPRHEAGMELLDGTPLYERKDPAMAVHPKWGTLLYDYGSPMVKNFLISNALFWLKEFHADGLRMDDVDCMLYLDYAREDGCWTPNMYGTNENLEAIEFFKHLNSIVKKQVPNGVLIAQEDGLWPQLTDSVENDHLGFDYKWCGGWTGDFLDYLSHEPAQRRTIHDQLTLSMLYAYCERYVLTLGIRDVGRFADFMEKLPGSQEQKLASVRAAYGYLMTHPGKKMLAPDPVLPEEMKGYLQDLLRLYRSQPALYAMDDQPEGFEWIQLMKYEENAIVFLRKTENPQDTLLAVCNFSEFPYEDYRVGVPFPGKYKEIFNSDNKKYGGAGVINPRVKMARREEWDERTHSIKIKVPALGCCIFTCTQEVKELADNKAAKAVAGREKKNLKKVLEEEINKQETAAEVKKTAERKPAARKRKGTTDK